MKGICFKKPLFHATIEGRKTQTRRLVVSSQEYPDGTAVHEYEDGSFGFFKDGFLIERVKPRYKVGDIVYLKEPYFDCQNCEGLYYDLYKYAGHELPYTTSKWENKLFMPESAARYFIKITAVRAERLQEISDEDCRKEGIKSNLIAPEYAFDRIADYDNGYGLFNTPREAYAALIDKINGKGTWDSNPWVWVYDYELIESVKPKE